MDITAIAPTLEAIASASALYNAVRTKARPLVDRFEARYTAWKQTWPDANPSQRRARFKKLTQLGVKILPLIVHKLCSETEKPVLQLYNAVEPDDKFKCQSPASIIAKNQQRNQNFIKYSKKWRAPKETMSGGGSSSAFTNCDEYMDLLDLGKGIIPNAMLAYYDDFGGWWDELLCELVSGHKSGAIQMNRHENYLRWIDWFKNKGGETEAPYKLVGEAAQMERWMRAGGVGNPHAELE